MVCPEHGGVFNKTLAFDTRQLHQVRLVLTPGEFLPRFYLARLTNLLDWFQISYLKIKKN